MRKNTIKKLMAFTLVGMLAVSNLSNVNVMAGNQKKEAQAGIVLETKDGIADFENGTANILLQGNDGQTLKGKEFQVHQLFHAENAAGGESIQYTLEQKYAAVLKTVVGEKLNKPAQEVTEYEIIDYIQTLNQNQVEGTQAEQKPEGSYSDFRYFVEEVRDAIRKENISGDTVKVIDTRQDNTVEIRGLTFGYYLVDEVSAVGGTHTASSLCMVSTANPDAEIHIKSDYPTIEKKIQEDDYKEMIGNDGWNDIGDYEIGQTVPYQFISHVPNMNGYHTYYFAWHDKMDKALTFKPETVQIVIKDADKEYVLDKSEFVLTENPTEEETFQVEIQDLKKIVDREFNKMNDLKENIYGQEITLRFDAVLNDNASNDTGRPGFENDVKLEFSNNPDSDGNGSTGETQWDTVVCFTYKLNGLKTNNHGTKLEGAKFRLYADAECTQEIYVKKDEKGYIVINRDSAGESVPENAVEMVSDEEGIFTIYGLDGGTYYLKETEAPAGYRPILDPIKLEVIPTYTDDRNNYLKGDGATDKTLKTLEFVAYINQFVNGAMKEDTVLLESNIEEGSGNLTVINEVGKKLPSTGSQMMIFVMGAGMLCMAFGLRKARKNK